MSISSIQNSYGTSYSPRKISATQQILPQSGNGSSGSNDLSARSDSSNDSSAADAFLSFMSQTPAQQLQTAWLAQHGISKEQFASMSASEQQKLIDQMKAEIKEKVAQKTQASLYTPVNVIA